MGALKRGHKDTLGNLRTIVYKCALLRPFGPLSKGNFLSQNGDNGRQSWTIVDKHVKPPFAKPPFRLSRFLRTLMDGKNSVINCRKTVVNCRDALWRFYYAFMSHEQSIGNVVKVAEIVGKVSEIVVTFSALSPSRCPLLTFTDLMFSLFAWALRLESKSASLGHLFWEVTPKPPQPQQELGVQKMTRSGLNGVSEKDFWKTDLPFSRLIKVLHLKGENWLQNTHFYKQKGPCLKAPLNWTGSVFPLLKESSCYHSESCWPGHAKPLRGLNLVAHDCGRPLSRYTCRATRVAADFRKVADVWKKDVWEFQAKSGSLGSCRLFLHFLGKIAVRKNVWESTWKSQTSFLQTSAAFWDFLDLIAFCRCSTSVALHPLKILVSHLPPPVPGGVAPKFGSEKVSRYTGVSQLQLRVSRYTVQLRA